MRKVLLAMCVSTAAAAYSIDQCQKIGADLVAKFKAGSECADALDTYLFSTSNTTDGCPTETVMRRCVEVSTEMMQIKTHPYNRTRSRARPNI
jgi:hypothetical protein